ncbi:MAG: AIR synthase-related protein [Opitutales bacterium]
MVAPEITDRYRQRGVSSSKEEVHAVVDGLDRGLFPGAFCKITEDYLTGNPSKCNVIHVDGAGTKSILAYLWYRETGDASVFRGTAQDSLVMNLDDLACVGATDDVIVSSTVNRNARNFPGEALAELIAGNEEFLEGLRELGVRVTSCGGETADVGDLTGTVIVDSCAVATLDRDQVVDNAAIGPGLTIVGFSSSGQATYEKTENSGIGSNGLTSARHDLLAPTYKEKYPESHDPKTPEELAYCGPYQMDDPLPDSNLTVGQALLSPTRCYVPLVKAMLAERRDAIAGLVHCSGGGQTKCLRFGVGVKHVKDNLLRTPAVFQAIQKVSGTSDEEMHRVYNMGHRLEAYCEPSVAEDLISIAGDFGVDAQVVGRTEPSELSSGANHLLIQRGDIALSYDNQS